MICVKTTSHIGAGKGTAARGHPALLPPLLLCAHPLPGKGPDSPGGKEKGKGNIGWKEPICSSAERKATRIRGWRRLEEGRCRRSRSLFWGPQTPRLLRSAATSDHIVSNPPSLQDSCALPAAFNGLHYQFSFLPSLERTAPRLAGTAHTSAVQRGRGAVPPWQPRHSPPRGC